MADLTQVQVLVSPITRFEFRHNYPSHKVQLPPGSEPHGADAELAIGGIS